MSPRRAALAAAALVACTSPQPCPRPLQECSGQCVDVQSNVDHCGGCGQVCTAGEACVGGVCGTAPNAACSIRTGGAFVTLEACGQVAKLWIANVDFIAAAQQYVGQPPPNVPVFTVQNGTDCDLQWTWHVNDAAAYFQASPPSTACDVCPRDVVSPGTWCPTTSPPRSVKILAVEVR